MAKVNIPPELLEKISKKWHDLTFVAASFRRTGLLGPNTGKDIVLFVRYLKRKYEDLLEELNLVNTDKNKQNEEKKKKAAINTKNGSSRKL